MKEFLQYENCIACEVICNMASRFMRYGKEHTEDYLDMLYELYREHEQKVHLIK